MVQRDKCMLSTPSLTFVLRYLRIIKQNMIMISPPVLTSLGLYCKVLGSSVQFSSVH